MHAVMNTYILKGYAYAIAVYRFQAIYLNMKIANAPSSVDFDMFDIFAQLVAHR